MGIDAGNTAIGQKYDQKRATVDGQVAKQQEATEAAKQQAITESTNAWEEVNKNESDTFTGAIAEAAGDFIGAMGATFEAGNAVIMDAISDAYTEAYDNISDKVNDAGEAIEKGANMVGNFFNGVMSAGKQMLENLTKDVDVAFEEGTLENHPEESEEA